MCAPVLCRMYCEFGWAKGPDGCDMCKCKEAPSKPGFCPAVESDQLGTCEEECGNDDDCEGNQKCCSNGCGHVCTAPEYKGVLMLGLRIARCIKTINILLADGHSLFILSLNPAGMQLNKYYRLMLINPV